MRLLVHPFRLPIHQAHPFARAVPEHMQTIPDLLRSHSILPNTRSSALFHAIYDVREERAQCVAPAPLARKYSVEQQNAQTIVQVHNRFTGQRTFWNAQRTAKPQSFAAAAALEDPTVSKGCDFCSWQELTATDGWGRVENEHCVTASNLFKITRHHGLVLFKHHNPLECSRAQMGSLLDASQRWVHQTHASSPHDALWPLLMWNSGPRSGASQFHPHAQILMNHTPLPDLARRRAAAAAFSARSGGLDETGSLAPAEDGASRGYDGRATAAFERACADAHAALGLRRVLRIRDADAKGKEDIAWVYHEVQPLKDCDTVVLGTSIQSPAFIALLHCALRTFVDGCGVMTFNASVTGLTLTPSDEQDAELGCVVARLVSRGKVTSAASDYGALEVFTGASIGHTSPWRIAAKLDEEAQRQGLLLDGSVAVQTVIA